MRHQVVKALAFPTALPAPLEEDLELPTASAAPAPPPDAAVPAAAENELLRAVLPRHTSASLALAEAPPAAALTPPHSESRRASRLSGQGRFGGAASPRFQGRGELHRPHAASEMPVEIVASVRAGGEDVFSLASTTPASRQALPVRLEVNTREFLLWVYRGESVMYVFPIGIGAGDTTPTGTYYIANKLEHPDWYNQGDPIPAGDPRNPIGHYWMGLGDATGATPYGLHPTEDAHVAGSEKSRGCIRLRPQDAQTLFDLCEVGTEVRIR